MLTLTTKRIRAPQSDKSVSRTPTEVTPISFALQHESVRLDGDRQHRTPMLVNPSLSAYPDTTGSAIGKPTDKRHVIVSGRSTSKTPTQFTITFRSLMNRNHNPSTTRGVRAPYLDRSTNKTRARIKIRFQDTLIRNQGSLHWKSDASGTRRSKRSAYPTPTQVTVHSCRTNILSHSRSAKKQIRVTLIG